MSKKRIITEICIEISKINNGYVVKTFRRDDYGDPSVKTFCEDANETALFTADVIRNTFK